MASTQHLTLPPGSFATPRKPPYIEELEAIFKAVKIRPIQKAIRNGRIFGPRGYPVKALWRAYLASFVLNLPHTNALIRRLEDDCQLRELCGFNYLPHRVTFNRFIQKLSDHPEAVQECLTSLTNKLRRHFKDFGKEVAVDATVIRSHSRAKKTGCSDPEADWGITHSPQSRDEEGKAWVFGYKQHMVADANHGIPIYAFLTPGNRNESPLLPRLFKEAKATFDWFNPKVAMADRGYDSAANHQFLHKQGILPIIHIRKSSADSGLYHGLYNEQGVPICLGKVPMEYVATTDKGHHLYRCRKDGCQLPTHRKGSVRHCDTFYLQDPTEDIRLFGSIRRDGPKWRKLYGKRWRVEQLFKSMKESRRLEAHCVRGYKQVSLHAMMSTLAFQATAFVKAEAGRKDEVRWMVRKVA